MSDLKQAEFSRTPVSMPWLPVLNSKNLEDSLQSKQEWAVAIKIILKYRFAANKILDNIFNLISHVV